MGPWTFTGPKTQTFQPTVSKPPLMDRCDKVANAETVDLHMSTLKHSVLLVGILLGIIFTFALYTAGIFFLGYWYGRRRSSTSVMHGQASHKMAMPPVTYTSVRGHKKPCFEYSERTEGCWSDWFTCPTCSLSCTTRSAWAWWNAGSMGQDVVLHLHRCSIG